MQMNLFRYCLQLADNALILGHRLSEWCGHGPVLEQDIALSNMALDHLGQARFFYQFAAQRFGQLSEEQQKSCFSSPALDEKRSTGKPLDEDDLAYLRDGWDFQNILLVEQPNRDWAYTIVRSYFYDQFQILLYDELARKAPVQEIRDIAEKSLKEVRYHLNWSAEWMIRLGDGTEESHRRLQLALEDMAPYRGELFVPSPWEASWLQGEAGIDLSAMKTAYDTQMNAVLEEAGVVLPDASWTMEGGKEGRHSEHLGYILAELQFVQRAYPHMEW